MPAQRGRVLVVGSVNVDFVVRTAALPTAGETVAGGEFAQHHGGKGANQAVAAARLGADVLFVGAVGDDELGRSAVADLRAEGLDTSAVLTLPGVATGVALIAVDAHGQNQISVASGANARLDGRLVEAALSDHALDPGGVFLANLEIPDEALLAGARIARQAGLRLVIDPAPARPLPDELLELGPLLVPNEGEAAALSGQHDPEVAARELAARSSQAVIVKLGADGALLCDGIDVSRFAAPRVDVVDTTGGGDTFAGALAAELATGAALDDAVRFAVAAAALSVTGQGARGGMPTREEMRTPGR